MKSATQIMISAFGGFVGLMGVEHGIGEVLQGSTAPSGIMILSWPDSEFFGVLSGEPAMTILPNLLVTGILAILVSLIYLIWAVLFVQHKHGGLVLMVLSVLMLLVGGGIFPPILGLLIGAAATRLQSPPAWLREHLSTGARQFLQRLWPWSFGACLLAWLSMFPGVPVLNYFFGVYNDTLIFTLLVCMFGFLIVASVTGFARDVQGQLGLSSGA